ncbi:SDR family NAD(P)-dependent oxidoreductase [Streptomyces sp. NPDC048720]|uniref:SDR family NAD(P)-dependent oxidoreductase n=1 Tax=Streptomyces sp. NPDC048720 TaxID=3365588 RepID=UPI003717B8AD
MSTDVRAERAVREAVDRTVDTFGRIDIVANNAGYALFGAVEETMDAEARALFDTNVLGVLNVHRAVLREQRSGHILQGSSLLRAVGPCRCRAAGHDQNAVEGISDALAAEVAPLGIHVTIIEPRPTATAFLANLHFATAIDAYDQTVRAVQKSLSEAPPEALSSPASAAKAILTATHTEHPPLRPLGNSGRRRHAHCPKQPY